MTRQSREIVALDSIQNIKILSILTIKQLESLNINTYLYLYILASNSQSNPSLWTGYEQLTEIYFAEFTNAS